MNVTLDGNCFPVNCNLSLAAGWQRYYAARFFFPKIHHIVFMAAK
jgi:hypothetical protein